MSAEARKKLAALQGALVAALLERRRPPDGFDTRRLEAAALSLAKKRLRSVARAWPSLAEGLGVAFAERFATFAAVTPMPRHGGPLADGRSFARWLATRGELPEQARNQALAVDVRFKTRADGLAPRRGPCVRLALLKQPRRLWIALRLPWLGVWWFAIPLGRR